jgi:hypothetical protein
MNWHGHFGGGYFSVKNKNFRGILMALLLVAATCWNPPPAWAANLQEVAAPAVISQLAPAASGTPQIYITSPRSEEILPSGNINVNLQVTGTSIFKNATFGIGPHLHLVLDGIPSSSVYDLSQPIALPNLTPGTHTLQVFAAKPWHESWKNPGALVQVTFHVLAKSIESPSPNTPRLLYSPPNNFGAEPFLLDFDLTNPPSHPDPEHPQQIINDWQVRATINNQSFLVDRWPPIYLKGMNPGANLIKLEYLDKTGRILDSSIRVVSYQPNGQDGFSRLLRNEIPLAKALALFDPNSRTLAVIPAQPPASPSAAPVPAISTEIAKPIEPVILAPTVVASIPPLAPAAPAVPVLPAPIQTITPAPANLIPTATPALPVSPVVPVVETLPKSIAPSAIATGPSSAPTAPSVSPGIAQPIVVSPIPTSPASLPIPAIAPVPTVPLPPPAKSIEPAKPNPPMAVQPVEPGAERPSTSLAPSHSFSSPSAIAPAGVPIAIAPRNLAPPSGEEVVELKVIFRELCHTLGVRIKQATNQIPPLVAQWSQSFRHWVSDRMQAMRAPQPAADSTASPV